MSPWAPLDCDNFSDHFFLFWMTWQFLMTWQFWGLLVRYFVDAGICVMLFLLMPAWHHRWRWRWLPGWDSVCQVSPLWSYSLFPPFPYCTLWGEVTMHSPHLGEYAHSPWGQVSYINYLDFCTGDLCILLHLFTYPTIYLYQCRFMDFFLYFGL